MNTPLGNPHIPEDLRFVWDKYDPKIIAENFKHAYAQVFPETMLQHRLSRFAKNAAEKITKKETFALYGVREEYLYMLYEKLETMAIESGIIVNYSDMIVFVEDDYYGNDHEEDHVSHAETARSDGKVLLLEKDIEKAGGIQGRTYDLLHLAFGHMIQWSTEDPVALLTREESWSIGYRNHEKSPDRILDMMSLYEFEAGMQGVEALRIVIDKCDIPEGQKEGIIQYFVDYVYCDRDYIIQHYRGNHESFQKFWKFGMPIPPRKALPVVSEFIKRHTVEIGLIQDKQ